jgi:hypothetical protein
VLPAWQHAYPAGSWALSPASSGRPDIGVFQIPANQEPVPSIAVARVADFGGFVRLLGFTIDPAAPVPGSVLTLHALWQIEKATPSDYKLFVHLLGPAQADGTPVIAQHDNLPCDDSYPTTDDAYPTTLWTPGFLLAMDTPIDLPADVPPGQYTLQTGWYDSVSGARAPVSDDSGPHANDAAQLQQVIIAPP